MSKLPQIDFARAWSDLPGATRDEIGAMVLREAFLRFVSGDMQGDHPDEGVRYLDRDGQQDADAEADEIASDLQAMIQGSYPELFGENPSLDHPNGKDPAWARPIVFKRADTAGGAL